MPASTCDCGRQVEVRDGACAVTCCHCLERRANPRPPSCDGDIRPTSSIRAAVERECCNLHGGMHQGDRPCSVLSGVRCPWFESAVLPGLGDKGLVDEYQALYIGGERLKAIRFRRCGCGAPLGRRERVCPRCRHERRRARWREAQRRHRSS